jgi:hypothetical protein
MIQGGSFTRCLIIYQYYKKSELLVVWGCTDVRQSSVFPNMLYLYQLLSFYSTEGGTSWQYRNFVVYCDNKSLVQVVSAKVKRTRQEYVNETMESEWDVVQAIVQCIKQLGTVDLRHVKGHQTEKSAGQPLPLSAKLNNDADAIATAFQEHTKHRDDLVIPISGSQAYLQADAVFPIKTSEGADANFLPRRTITRGVRKFLRDIYGTRRICEHIKEKEGWTDDVFHSVDWISFSSAMANTKESRTFIIKLINDYLPVGKRVRLYKPYYEAQCPSCDAPEEDREHVFHCPAADRERWRTEFLKKLAKKCTDLSTSPALKSVLVTSLECMLYMTQPWS